jgi:hypothetical protein
MRPRLVQYRTRHRKESSPQISRISQMILSSTDCRSRGYPIVMAWLGRAINVSADSGNGDVNCAPSPPSLGTTAGRFFITEVAIIGREFQT